jgi:hypothetical protein
MTLRGAGVEADAHHVQRAVVGVGLVALSVAVVGLFLIGAHKNAQITRLHQEGVAVAATVSSCHGLMGGSGSNLVGYDCRATFTLDGRRFDEALPGTAFHPPGATLRAVSVPGDPALLSTVSALAGQHPSRRVFVLPTVLLGVLALMVAALVRKRRRNLSASSRDGSVTARC